MNTSAKGKTVTPNYSHEQVQRIIDSAPIDLEKAKALAEEFGKSYQSVIAKCYNLEVEYVSKPKPSKKVAAVTKAELVEMVEAKIDRKLSGLEKTTAKVLVDLISGIDHILHSEES